MADKTKIIVRHPKAVECEIPEGTVILMYNRGRLIASFFMGKDAENPEALSAENAAKAEKLLIESGQDKTAFQKKTIQTLRFVQQLATVKKN